MVRAPSLLPKLRGRRGLIAAAMTACLIATPTAMPAARAVEPIAGGYSPDADYGRGSLVVGSDGNVYRALDAVKGKDPVSAKDAPWQLAHVAFDMTLDVPAKFDTIEKAFTVLANATIGGTATVTIQLAPGTYEMKGPLAVGHRDGRRVVLKGGKDRSKTILACPREGGLVVNDGRSARLETVTIEGQRKDQTAILINDDGSVMIRDVAINGFGIGIHAENRSEVVADDVDITTEDGSAGVKLDSLSSARLTRCTMVRSKRDALGGHSYGVVSNNGATAHCHKCTASGWLCGYQAGRTGSMELYASKATGNCIGSAVYLNATLSMIDCTLEKNSEDGLSNWSGTADVHDCRFLNNKRWGVSGSGPCLTVFWGASVITGHEAALRSWGGARFDGKEPTTKGNSEKLRAGPAKTAENEICSWR